MLRAAVLDDFNGADTLLIWGDEHGLARFRQVLSQLSSGAITSAAIHEIASMHAFPGLRILFELGENELRIDRNGSDVVIVAVCSADLLAGFVDKVAELADAARAAHQYLDWPCATSIEVMVSKGEYPDDFGGI